MFSVRFRNFWPNYDRTRDNFFIPLIASAIGNDAIKIVSNPKTFVDLEISSVYQRIESHRLFRRIARTATESETKEGISYLESSRFSKTRVWFSGENKRPPLEDDYDLYLGFDGSEFDERCFYLPLWVLNLDWFGMSSSHGFTSTYQSQQALLKNRDLSRELYDRVNFCCIFANHLNQSRKSAIEALSILGNIDLFGGVTKKYVRDKFHVAKKYRFILCFENSLYPGYVTEKLVEAYQTTAIPLYWGHDSQEYFNQDSNVNFANFDSMNSFVTQVSRIEKSQDSYIQILNAPLLKNSFDMQNLINRLKALIFKN